MPSPRPADAARPDVAPPPAERPRPRPTPGPRPTPAPRASGEGLAGGAAEQPAAPDLLDQPNSLLDEPNIVAPEAVQAGDVVDGADLDEELAALDGVGLVPQPGQPDVWDLVRRAQEGEAEAFGELYDHYVTMVHRYVYSRVGDRALAEDVTSETFVRALRRIDSLSFQGRDVGAWLVTIARNIIRDHVKSSRFRLEVTTADMRDADRATEGPEDAVVSRLTNEQLLACVKQLGSEQQECITLRFLHGLSVSETAEIMGKKDGAIKALQHRAVRRLAVLLPEGLR
jgi:RNA polymerase sigma-70 factor (TIGR02952 family)